MTTVMAAWSRTLGLLGRSSMYLLTMLALEALSIVAIVLAIAGQIAISPVEIVVTLIVLLLACVGVNWLCTALLRLPPRIESPVITALILLFVLRPTLDPMGLCWIALAGALAAGSKYLLAWRGRHIFNPAAVGIAVVTLSGLSPAAWWVGTPALAAAVIVLGLLVLLRTERVRVVVVFLLVVVGVTVVRLSVAGLDSGEAITFALWQSPFLFLGAFMVSEPATLPPRRWQQFTVAALVGVLAGWPIDLGAFTLGQERALLIGNLLAFVWMQHRALRLRYRGERWVTPTVREMTFEVAHPVRFAPGQYLQLQVPHHRSDPRGTRREFSIVTAPSESGVVRVAYRAITPDRDPSSFKRALAEVKPGTTLVATGVWGDFLLPSSRSASVLLVAAGVGITPFVSQLQQMRAEVEAGADPRDIVLLYVASGAAELAFRAEIEVSGIPVVVFTPDRPEALPPHWRWAEAAAIDQSALASAVPDLSLRHAYISGAPRTIAAILPALEAARSVTSDAFAGY